MSLTSWRILEDGQVKWGGDGGGDQNCGFVYVKLDMSVTPLKGDIKQTTEYISLELREEDQAMGTNLQSSAYTSISSIDEITK